MLILGLLKKLQYNSPVILTFTLLLFGALLLGAATGGVATGLLFSVYRAPLGDPLAYLRIVTYVLGHVDFTHLYGNVLIILLIGPILEERYGSAKMLLMILATALVAGLAHLAFSPASTRLLGASGIVFMLVVLGSFVNFQKGRVPLTFVLIMALYIGREVYALLTRADQISYITHIAGGLCGAALGFCLNRGRPEIPIDDDGGTS